MARKRAVKTVIGDNAADGAVHGSTVVEMDFAPGIATDSATDAEPSGATDAEPKAATLMLDATLEIGQVSAVRQGLLAFLDGGTASAVDVSRISSIDTAGVQLLLAVRREAELRGMPLRFLGESAALARALERLGLAASLPMAHADAG